MEQQQAAPPPQEYVQPIVALQRHFMRDSIMEKIAKHCGTNSDGVERIVRGIVNAVRRSQDDRLVTCTPQSFVNCVYDAHALSLPIDKRDLCYLVRYGNEATIQPSYKGYLFRLEKNLEGFFHKEFIWWEDEEFTYWDESGVAKYIYKPKKAARSDYKNAIGVAFYASWWVRGEKLSAIETIDHKELMSIKSKAKSSKVWDQWLGEQMQKAVIRRFCKDRFSSLTADLDERDNEHFSIVPGEGNERPQTAAERFQQKMSEEKYNPFPGEGPEPVDAEFTDMSHTMADPVHESAEDVHIQPESVPEPENEAVGHDLYDGCEEWNEMLYLDGKRVHRTFANINAAYGYFVTVVSKRKSRESRWALLMENRTLMASLCRHHRGIHDSLVEMANAGEAGNESGEKQENGGNGPPNRAEYQESQGGGRDYPEGPSASAGAYEDIPAGPEVRERD